MSRVKKRASEQVADGIVRLIEQNNMGPGAMLPSIDKLAETFEVARGTVREALQNLASAGLVDVQHGRGISVTRPRLSDVFRSVPWRALADGMGVSELLEARLAVETMTARLAAQRATAEQVDELNALISKMKSASGAGDHEALISADTDFHNLVAKASGNRPLADFVSILRELLLFTIERNRLIELSSITIRFHEEIVRA
ncbi:MAG: FCD domain-containing protein, partial [Firmicutes bacterium]|nr:FCD domain-containing protein [Bacillota bacterium]